MIVSSGARGDGRLDRRSFLLGIGAAATLAACSSGSRQSTAPPTSAVPDLPRDPFTLGVASGDPLDDSVILWTRLAPRPLRGGGMPSVEVPVRWEVATDRSFTQIVADGTAVADPAWGHSVHIDVRGLEPATDYVYRFWAGSHRSPLGTTRTAPAAGSAPGRVRFALTSCQHLEHGYYTAYPHLADEDLDLVLFLGDYIYEYAPSPGKTRRHRTAEATTVPTYRDRYAEYKLDAGLQAAHAAHPWTVLWDDHEVANNYVSDHPEDDQPRAAFLRRRAAAYKVWYEHMPVRLDPPQGPDYEVYRQLVYGDLVSFFALDTRQYRSEQACGYPIGDVGPPCDEMDDPGRDVLGGDQETWLEQSLAASGARWNVVAQQTMLSERRMGLGTIDEIYQLDAWDGYRPSRQRVVDALADPAVSNPVVLTGDIHTCLVADVHADPTDGSSPVVATELGGVSMSSVHDGAGDLITRTSWEAGLMPHVKFLDASRHGYLACEVTAEQMTADFRLVETIERPESSISTGPSWVIAAGTAGARVADGLAS